MSEGLQRAVLAALCTRGPWKGAATRHDPAWVLTSEELCALYAAVGNPPAMCRALGVAFLSDRKADRALQLLRRAGLIEYAGSPKHWRRAGAADAGIALTREPE